MNGWDDSDEPGLDLEADKVWRRREEDNLATLAQAQATLRRHWADDELERALSAAADRLNSSETCAPSLSHALQTGLCETRAETLTAGWVDPAHVAHFRLQRWNDFGSHRPQRVGEFARILLSGDAASAAEAFCIPRGGAVSLFRVTGPAGPLYELAGDGAHRLHAARLLGFPLIWAQITQFSPPLTLNSRSDVEERGQRGGGRRQRIAQTVMRWRGLISRGLVVGDIDDADSNLPDLHLTRTVAPWLPLSSERVVAWSRHYERVYPGALAAIGIPPQAWSTPEAWDAWLTQPC
ncbi:hypothetical protein [Streptosporangium canum]|uniref:hypothetical protein n=1 Tax=Streptosporangium canum TaxID=324952 RepID=UPI0037986D71